MKKLKSLITLLSLISILFIAGCDGTPNPNSFPLMQVSAEYEIDTWGFNSEVYEFTPKTNKNYTCVMLMLDSGSSVGLQCFPKETVKDI